MSSPHNHLSKTNKLDIAIIGGGSAGITLAAKLTNFSGVVVEPKTPLQRDCSWALWANGAQKKQFQAAVKGSWQQWRVRDHSTEVLHQSDQFHYISLSSAKYMTQCESDLVEGVDLIRATAEDIQIEGEGGSFNAAGQRYRADKIYDSRPPKMPPNSLKQHFLGWEIRTRNPISDPQIATLMDFRVDQSRGLHFIYVLPFSDRHLLIESTMISKDLQEKVWYQQAIQQWLKDQNIEIEEILGEETGIIPMNSLDPLEIKPRAIGAASGAVRLSSGYAFANIQVQINTLAEGINNGDFSVPKPISSFLNKMDKIFNAVLMAQPELGVTIMVRTAKALDADGFARFMLGTATLIDWAKVILAMPKIAFIKQLLPR